MTVGLGRGGALLLLLLVTPMSAVGQAFQDANFSFLLGGVADAREDNLPFSPYLDGFGLRLPGFLLENGVSLELRRLAEEDDQGRFLDRWELLFGLQIR